MCECRLQVVNKWGPDEVSQWLESVGLPMYCHAFKEHEISGTELLSLERRDFKDVGVTKVSWEALLKKYVEANVCSKDTRVCSSSDTGL